MVKEKEKKPIYQWCIKTTYFNEVMQLPKDVKIVSLSFEVGFSLKREVSVVPKALANLGVTYMRQPTASVEARGILSGKSRAQMKTTMQSICTELQLPIKHVRIIRMEVGTKEGTATFTRMTKKIEIGDGKTEMMKVLGIVRSDGDESNIINLCGAKKFVCKYDTQLVRTVICSEE